MLSKWAKLASTQWKLFFFFLLENWFPFIFHLCFMLYILVLKICLKYFKHYIQLSQMSKMSNSRSRAQYITLKLIPLDSAPLNWGRRQDRNSYFYHQMLFLGVIFLVRWVKWAITWSKPKNIAWEPILLDSAPLNYVKKSASKALLKIAPNVLFFVIPTSL